MKLPGLPALALALSTLLVIAWSVSAASCGPTVQFWDCASPDGMYLGTADNNDPTTCPCFESCCIDGPLNLTYPRPGRLFQGSCSPDAGPEGGIMCGPGTVLVGNECLPASDGGDAGEDAEAGPLPTCDGQCWPLPPEPNWTGPLLLGIGGDGGLPACPSADASAPVWAGFGSGTSAIACNSTASGTCPDLIHVCGPVGAPDFSTCVVQTGDVPCPLVPPYVERQLFYETAVPPSLPATTFCCLATPDAGPPTN